MHRSRTRYQLPPGQQYRSSRISELAALAKFHLPDWWNLELHRKTPLGVEPWVARTGFRTARLWNAKRTLENRNQKNSC